MRQSDSGKDPPKQKYDPFILHNGGILKKREKRRKKKKNGENSPFFKCDPFRTRVMCLGNGLDFISRLKTPFCLEISVSRPYLIILARKNKSIWFHLAFRRPLFLCSLKGLNRFIFASKLVHTPNSDRGSLLTSISSISSISSRFNTIESFTQIPYQYGTQK